MSLGELQQGLDYFCGVDMAAWIVRVTHEYRFDAARGLTQSLFVRVNVRRHEMIQVPRSAVRWRCNCNMNSRDVGAQDETCLEATLDPHQ